MNDAAPEPILDAQKPDPAPQRRHRTMQVTINGQSESLAEGVTLAALLTQRELTPARVAIELNEDVVRRVMFEDTVIRAGDHIEIVSFVGGG